MAETPKCWYCDTVGDFTLYVEFEGTNELSGKWDGDNFIVADEVLIDSRNPIPYAVCNVCKQAFDDFILEY